MPPLEILVRTGLYVLMGGAVLAAIGAVALPNLFHAGLALAALLIGVAGIYISVGAEFLAMVQILIYVGAVMTLIIYAIMLTVRVSAGTARASNRQSLPALAAGVLFIYAAGRWMTSFAWPVHEEALTAAFSVKNLGITLMKAYVFPFEVIGFLLFAVLIGALVVARRDKD